MFLITPAPTVTAVVYTSIVSVYSSGVQMVLQQHTDALNQASLAILKSESLTGQELKDIMAQYPPHDPPPPEHGQVS